VRVRGGGERRSDGDDPDATLAGVLAVGVRYLNRQGSRATRPLLPARLSRDEEETVMRPYAIVGELLLSDGTTYTRLATYEAPDMEAALRRAAMIVRQWRGERIADHPIARVREIVEVQVSEDHAAP